MAIDLNVLPIHPKRLSFSALLFCFAVLVFPSNSNSAQEAAQSFSLDGRLFSDSTSTSPLVDASIVFKVQILDENKTCVLYEEQQSLTTAASNGFFSANIGTSTGDAKRTSGDSNNSMATVFQNSANISGKLLSNGSACTLTATNGKKRYARVTISPSTLGGTPRTLTPDLPLDSMPSALIAERAESVQGVSASQILQVNTSGGNVLSQANLESIFSSTARFNALTALVDGTSTAYMKTTSAAGAALPVVAGSPSTPVAGSIWYDSTDSTLKYQTGVGTQTLSTGGGGSLPANGGTAAAPGYAFSGNTNTGVYSSTADTVGISTGGSARVLVDASGNVGIGTTNPLNILYLERNQNAATTQIISNMNSGNTASTGVEINSDDVTLSLIAGSSTYSTSAVRSKGTIFSSKGLNLSSGTTSDEIRFSNNLTNELMRITGTGNVGIGTASPARLLQVAGPMRMSASALPSSPAAGDMAVDSGDSNKLKWYDGSAWQNAGGGGGAPSGSAGGDLSGTYPNPAVAKIQGVAVSTTAPAAGQVLSYSSGSSSWEPANFSVGSLLTAAGAQQFSGSSSCSASQTLTWSSLTNTFTCSNIAGLDGGVITSGTVAGARLPLSATAWTVSGSDVYYTTGNVGIGTASPTSALTVSGSINASSMTLGTGVNGVLNMAGDESVLDEYPAGTRIWPTMSGSLNLTTSGSTASTKVVIGYNDNTSYLSALEIGNTASGYGKLLLMKSGGNVGIGTTAPAQTLVVNGTSAIAHKLAIGQSTVNSAAYLHVRRNTGATGDENIFLDNVEFGANKTSTIMFTTGGTGYARISGGQDGSANSVLTFSTGTPNPIEKMRIDANGNVGIGTTSPTRLLDVAGPIHVAAASLPGTPATGDVAIDSGDSNKLKWYNGSSWQTAGGSGSIAFDNLTDGALDSVNGNLFLGLNTGSTLTTGYNNLGIGAVYTLTHITSGVHDVALGMGALYSLTSGGTNVAIGTSTGESLTTSSGNTLVGSGVLQSGTADNGYNTAIGYGALTVTSGGSNIAIGAYAGNAITSGERNVIIGSNTGSGIATSSNNIIISDGAGNDRIHVNSSGQVGIGTTSPGAPLHVVAGSPYVAAVLESNCSGCETWSRLGNTASSIGGSSTGLYFYASSTTGDVARLRGFSSGGVDGYFSIETLSSGIMTEKLKISTAGDVGIGNTNPSYKLDVTGDVNASGCVRASGSTIGGTCSSDARLKKDVQPFNLGLNALLGIQPKYFRYNGLGEHPESNDLELGVVAQDVEKTAPELIVKKDVQLHPEDAEKTEIKQVNYTAFLYVLINSVKELAKEVFLLKEKVSQIQRGIASEAGADSVRDRHNENRIEQLEKENQELKARLEKLELLIKSK